MYNTIKSYDIIEIEFVENYFRKALRDFGINYIQTIQAEFYDILYSNSCIQYMSSTTPVLNCISQAFPTYIVFDDVYISQKDQFFCHQKYYGSTMVINFVNFQQLNEAISNLGYILILTDVYTDRILGRDGKIPFDDTVLEDWRPRERYTFIFKRNRTF